MYNQKMIPLKINKTMFFILSFSWGILYTGAGFLIAFVLTLTGNRAKRWGWAWYFEIGKRPWGGMEWGPVFVKDRSSGDHLKNHEFGHALQNCLYGPFMIILVSLPSTVRYWTRRVASKRGRSIQKPYEAVWFEKQATEWGVAVINRINKV